MTYSPLRCVYGPYTARRGARALARLVPAAHIMLRISRGRPPAQAIRLRRLLGLQHFADTQTRSVDVFWGAKGLGIKALHVIGRNIVAPGPKRNRYGATIHRAKLSHYEHTRALDIHCIRDVAREILKPSLANMIPRFLFSRHHGRPTEPPRHCSRGRHSPES